MKAPPNEYDAAWTTVRRHQVPPDVVVTVTGGLDDAALCRLRAHCLAELDDGAVTLTLDFTSMTDSPTALFRMLSQTNATVRERRARMHLVGLVEAVCGIVATAADR